MLLRQWGSGRVEDGRKYANVSISGVNNGYQAANHLTMLEGRFVDERDTERNQKRERLFRISMVNNMFAPGESPLGQEVKVYLGKDIYTFTIIGVYEYKQDALTSMMGAMASDQDLSTGLYIPITTQWKLTNATEGFSYITILTKQGTDSRALGKPV